MKPTATHLVEFSGRPTGPHPLTWGQLWMLRSMRRTGIAGEVVNVRKDGSLEGVRGVGDVLRALSLVMRRHDALRTRYRTVDGDEPTQTVTAGGELPVPVYDCGAADVSATVADVTRALVYPPFAPDELPIRVAVVTVDGAPTRLVLALHHLSADGLAAAVVYEEILRLSGDPAAALPDTWQPHQIAEQERGLDGERQAGRAVRYFAERLRLAARTATPAGPAGGASTCVWTRMVSPAVAAATARLRRLTGASEGTVLLAGYALALAAWSGRDECTVDLACANRQDPRMRRSVVNLVQLVPISFRVAADDFTLTCRRVAEACLRGARYGRHDPAWHDAARAEVEAETGSQVHVPYAANLRTIGQSDFDGPQSLEERRRLARYADIEPAGLAELLRRDAIAEERTPMDPIPYALHFSVWELAETAVVTLIGDSAAVGLDGPRRILEDVERTLVRVAQDHDLRVLA